MVNMHDRGNGSAAFRSLRYLPPVQRLLRFPRHVPSKDAKEKTDRILASKFDIVYDGDAD